VTKNAVEVHCFYLRRKCWRSKYPTDTVCGKRSFLSI